MSTLLVSEEDVTNVDDHADNTDRVIGGFLDTLRSIELTCSFDCLALSLLIQEHVTFGDIRLLAVNRRFIGAQARLRSLWESLIILKYVANCAPDPEQNARALFLYDAYKRANVMKANGVWNSIRPEEQREFNQFIAEFAALPGTVQQFIKAPIEQMHNLLLKTTPAELQGVEIAGVQVSQYDAMFRVLSARVHGGLMGSSILVEEWLNPTPPDATKWRFEHVGTVGTACSLLCGLVTTWTAHSRDPRLQSLWEQAVSVVAASS
jgi:hypothetical protein